MLIWNSIILVVFTITFASNHPLQDDSDPEIVEARRTQVLSEGIKQQSHQLKEPEEDEKENEKVILLRGQPRTNKHTQQQRGVNNKPDEKVDKNNNEETEEEKENTQKTRSKLINRSRSENESKKNKTVNEIKVKNDELIVDTSQEKTGNDSHKNYTRLELIRGRKSSSSTNRRQRTSSHSQTDTTSDSPDVLSETSFNNTKKRRRVQTTTSSTTPTPQTMAYNLYNHFRPLEQDVPQDHLLPFLDFGKKLSPGIPPTPSGINSIENRSNNLHHRQRTKEHVTPEYRSTLLDEDTVLHEDMDLTVVKKTIERNNAPRGKIALRDPYIAGYYRRRPTTVSPTPIEQQTTKSNLKNLEDLNLIATTTECTLTKDKETEGISNKYNNLSKIHNNETIKCELIDNNNNTTKQQNGQRTTNRTTKTNIEIINTRDNTTKLQQKFERMRMEPLTSETTNTRRVTTIKLNNDTINNNNNYDKNTTIPLITTISPTNQLTTRILSTAVVTSVSVKESLPRNNLKLNDTNDNIFINETSKILPKIHKTTNISKHIDNTFADSSTTKVIVKPTTETTLILNNKTIPDDFVEVPKLKNIKNITSTTTTTTIVPTVVENIQNKTSSILTNPLYKPKIILPRTQVIISSTTIRSVSPTIRNKFPTSTTTIKTPAILEDKIIKQNIKPLQSIPILNTTKININETLNTKDLTDNNFNETTTVQTLLNYNNDKNNSTSENNNTEILILPTVIYDNITEDVSKELPINNNTNETNIEEIIPLSENTDIKTEDEIYEHDQENHNFTETPIINNITEDQEIKSNIYNSHILTSTTTKKPSSVTLPDSPSDYKWSHTTGSRVRNNSAVSDEVGVAYPESINFAAYIFAGLGILPILMLALIVARVVIVRNRKKVLDESEYSSEYNRSPLSTSSPLPTKLPRVPAHLGWEVEKNPLPPIPVTSTRWEFPRDKLRLQTVLGQGNFGQVWKAEADDISGHEGLTRLVAVKTVKEGASNREREDLLRELGIMQELGAHPNVVTLLGCCTEKEPYLLIMEYVMYGKLLAFLRDHRTRAHYYNFSESTDALTSRDLTVFAYCVARGMDYLTTKAIIHRDLAARNVLVDHNKLCKIADFGMSRNVRDTGQIYEQRQSKGALPIRWMAPESLHFSLFTHKTDVWSFGILMWEIVTLGSTPYANMGAREVMRRVGEGYRLDRPNHCHQELFRVIQRCWHSEPAKRPTFAELKHELGQLLGDTEHGGGYVDLESLAEEIKHHNLSGSSTLQRPHNH